MPKCRVALLALLLLVPGASSAQKLEPLVYTLRFPAPGTRTFDVNVVVPTAKRDSVQLMMAIWSPGFYGLQNYATNVTAFTAKGEDGTVLQVEQPQKSRWTVRTGGRAKVVVSYTLAAPRGSNLSNGVTDSSAVIVGPATYITLVEAARRPAELRLELPAGWKNAITLLDAAPGGVPNHFVAPDYDVLADAPILAGKHLDSSEFTVAGIKHYWAWLGQAEWDGARVAATMKQLVEEHERFWGSLPFKKYVFLNIVTGGGGGSGIEHLNSVAIAGSSGREPTTPEARYRNAAFLSHEYFHAMNVKRLRPVELGPFDYENAPVTTGLWVSEGLTSYFGDLLAARAGLGTQQDWLNKYSRYISDLQTTQPGRLVQTLEQASAQMFERIERDKKVDYYIKGPVVGLILDAHIRRRTNDRKSLDDVMLLEYKRWSGARGFTADDFAQTASDAAGFDLKPLLRRLVGTTEELDYAEMLDWLGLRFVPNDPGQAWKLEVRPDASAQQKAHLAALLAPSM